MFWLNFIAKLIKVLHSGKNPKELSAGFTLGSIIGLTPFLSLHNLIIFGLIFLLKVNISAAFFGIFVFSAFAYLLDPLFHELGYFLLVKVEIFKPFWTFLYNIPIAPLTKFYNTVVLGSLVSSLCLCFPIYLGFIKLVQYYQAHFAAKVDQWKVMRIIKGSNLYQSYQKIKLN